MNTDVLIERTKALALLMLEYDSAMRRYYNGYTLIHHMDAQLAHNAMISALQLACLLDGISTSEWFQKYLAWKELRDTIYSQVGKR